MNSPPLLLPLHPSLRNDEQGLHAGATVRLAVVGVVSRGVERHDEGVALLAELLVHGDFFLIDARGNGLLVKDDVVGSSLVVDPARDDVKNLLVAKCS